MSFFAILLSAVTTWWLLRIFRPLFFRWLLDQPNLRSSHIQPVPRGGGLSFVLVSTLASFLALIFSATGASLSSPLVVAPLFAFPLALVGLFDDRYNIPATFRFGVQLITAVVVIAFSPLLSPAFSWLYLFPLLAFAVTAFINFTNFMDGLDGLVAGCMTVAITSVALKLSAPWPIWSLVGGLLGFLYWNWSPAKMFMGDVGSTFLGAVFAFFVLQSSTWSQAFSLLLVASPLLADAGLCLLRRLLAGQRVFQAHRLHLYQRLHQAGWPHSQVSILYLCATGALAIALFWGLPWMITIASLELMIGFWLDQQVAVPFFVSSRN